MIKNKWTYFISVLLVLITFFSACERHNQEIIDEDNKNLILNENVIHNMAKEASMTITAENENIISQGTAFFISENGYIITNYHIIQNIMNSGKITAKAYNGRVFDSISIIEIYYEKDLALLKANVNKVSYLKLKSNGYKDGDNIYVLGSPNGDDNVFIKGYLIDNDFIYDNKQCLKLSTALQEGNSGGPVLTDSGAVIGVASFEIEKNGLSEFCAISIKEFGNAESYNLKIYVNGDENIDKPICNDITHKNDDGNNHTYGFCGLAGHYNCQGINHKSSACKIAGHYQCDNKSHAQASCYVYGHYVCDKKNHSAASCGVSGHLKCDSNIHTIPVCGTYGHCVSDSLDHMRASCCVTGHYECDGNAHGSWCRIG